MRLKKVYISNYKNLNEFEIDFSEHGQIDIFVGKNGSGKSNFLEAIVEIFNHIYESNKSASIPIFDYSITYEIEGRATILTWKEELFFINGSERGQKTFSTVPLPENILIYYSGHNETITSVVKKYEHAFRSRIRGANSAESRHLIGVGSDYKALLLCTLLLQPIENRARQYILNSLGIQQISPKITLHLSRPDFSVGRFRELGIKAIEPFDARTHYWGADGITRDFLDRLVACVKGEFNHNDLYNLTSDSYSITIDVELYQSKFAGIQATEQFKLWDNLKILGMLSAIEAELQLGNNQVTTINDFSDGQFQSVYIYAIAELFKDRHCITVLDEPDSFLHPEWQFTFLKQVFDLADDVTQKNHILMSSHSASTISTANENTINLFSFENTKIIANKVKKSDVIRSLSAGLITFTESEARLNIHHNLKNTTGPVLFTEGITDEMILEVAWRKLYGTLQRPFEVQNAFSCGFLRNLVNDQALYQSHPNRMFFSLFDFDEAYNDWKQLGDIIQTDPYKGLVKKHKQHHSFSMLLPVPNESLIKNQVINPHTNGTYKNKSLLTIELLFYGVDGLDRYFSIDTSRTDNFIKFCGDKVPFARDVVPSIEAIHFEVIRPVFEFILSKC